MSLFGLIKTIVHSSILYCTRSYRPLVVRQEEFFTTPKSSSGVGYLHKGILRRLELALYYLVVMPLAAFLPIRLAYKVACLRADVLYRLDRPKRKRVLCSLQVALGDQVSQAELARIARDHFRVRSCEVVDVIRLAGSGRALVPLVEMRGLEHIEAALACGKGAILCSAHFGSYDSCFSLLGVHGFPVTVIGRWPSKVDGDRSWIEQFVFRLVYQKPVERHRRRPNIEPRAGQIGIAYQAANVLRQNELLAILVDPPVLEQDRARAVRVDFLNGKALLLPGVIPLAQLTKAPILMVFMYRSEDWEHQIVEISPPLSLNGDTVTDFRHCLKKVEDTIRQHPSHWRFWNLQVLVDLDLLPAEALKE